MKVLDLYGCMVGSMNDFSRQFKENEALYNQAKSFWRHLESFSIVSILIFIIFGLVSAYIYYIPYNKRAGRHYHPIHWAFFGIGTLLVTFITTIVLEYIFVAPKLAGAFVVELKVALCNAFYAAFLYFIISVVWCNVDRPTTNAYRIFKI